MMQEYHTRKSTMTQKVTTTKKSAMTKRASTTKKSTMTKKVATTKKSTQKVTIRKSTVTTGITMKTVVSNQTFCFLALPYCLSYLFSFYIESIFGSSVVII